MKTRLHLLPHSATREEISLRNARARTYLSKVTLRQRIHRLFTMLLAVLALLVIVRAYWKLFTE